jgi:hypothetical protein
MCAGVKNNTVKRLDTQVKSNMFATIGLMILAGQNCMKSLNVTSSSYGSLSWHVPAVCPPKLAPSLPTATMETAQFL